MSVALNERTEDEWEIVEASPVLGARHRRAPVSRAERAAMRAEVRAVLGTVVRHRRKKKNVIVAGGAPVLVAGAVAAAATTGTLSLSAGPANGSSGDLRLTGQGADMGLVLSEREGAERASRLNVRGILDGLLGTGGSGAGNAADGVSEKAVENAAQKAVAKAAPKAAAKDSKSGAAAVAKSAKRKEMRAPAFVRPLTNYRITARYGQSGSRWSRDHTGLDFAAPSGTPVRAVAAGTVVSAGWAGAYGLRTVVRHADGTRTWYAHQSRLIVKHGKVKAGQIIGRVGSTGNSTGPHMHLEVRRHGNATNPYTWLRQHGVRV